MPSKRKLEMLQKPDMNRPVRKAKHIQGDAAIATLSYSMSAQMVEVSLLGVRTALNLEMDAWSIVKQPRQAINEYPTHPQESGCFEEAKSTFESACQNSSK